MTTRKTPHPPPFAVGQRVRFTGDCTIRIDGREIAPGDEGTVTKNCEGSPAFGDTFGVIDGWSLVTFPNGATRAATHEDDGGPPARYEAVIRNPTNGS